MTRGYERTEGQKESDAEFVAERYKWGHSLRKIARDISSQRKYTLSHQAIKLHIDALLAEWRKNRIEDMDLAIQAELEKLNLIESEAWEAWENSKLSESGPVHQYLDKVEKCINRRCVILGMEAPRKQAISADVTTTEKRDLSGYSDEDLERMAEIISKY
jgi:hypothetical protein